jgi:hypothetical protein
MRKLILCAGLALLMLACNEEKKAIEFDAITAVPMPTTLASGLSFPTDSTLINSWIQESKIVDNLETNKDIITHGWDIWDALTAMTDHQNNGQPLRRFETWYTPGDIKSALESLSDNSSFKLEDLKRAHSGQLKVPHQHGHVPEVVSGDVVGFVKYDPSSAAHIFNNQLYNYKKLKSMIKPGKIANIPAFPSSTVAIKPVFQVLTDTASVKIGPDLYQIPAWPGYHNQISMDSVVKGGFGPTAWDNFVKITTAGDTDAANKVFSIKDFINFKLNQAQADSIIAGGTNFITGGTPKAGDYAVLVGMHVNTRENQRWTWQTFWWSEDPEAPQSPSSSLIASQKPASLDRAAKHYSMGVAYNMISPSQDYTKGSNANTKAEPDKTSVYAFNPYLEAGFPESTFKAGNEKVVAAYSKGYQRVGATKLPSGKYEGGVMNRVGIQTNCMSCHGQARMYDVDFKTASNSVFYITDQYFSLDAPYFESSIVLDFVWSIQGNLIDE